MFPYGEVLAADFCIVIVYFWYCMIVLDGILSILTDGGNGSTQQADVRHVLNLDQILTVGSLRRGDPDWDQPVNRSVTPKSCREGPGPLTISK